LSLALAGSHAAGPACLAFRPQGARLTAASGAPTQPALPAKVVSREFLGTLVRYHVAVGSHRILVDALHRRGEPPFEPGTSVDLALDADAISILRA
jgi:iron(III) transport system ATP-binding protein